MRYLLFFCVSVLLGCSQLDLRSLRDLDKNHYPSNTGGGYLIAADSVDAFLVREADSILRCAHEPALASYEGAGKAVRLVWLRSFGNPVIVRLNNVGDTVYAVVKEVVNPQLVRDTLFIVAKDKWQSAISALDQSAFWKRNPSIVPYGAKDGITWFLECRLPGKYRFVHGWDDGSVTSSELMASAEILTELGSQVVSMRSVK